MLLRAGIAAILVAVAPVSLAQESKPDPLIECAPETYSAALDCLDRHLSMKAKDQLRGEKGVSMAHFGLGMWMRNNWGLWGGGPLAEDMRRRGFTHADDMSSTIIGGYAARLKGEPFDVEGEAERYRAYWNKTQKGQEQR